MKASKRVENLLPSGILVVGLAAMALFGVGFSAFQTSNTMSPIENSIDVEVGSIIEGGKTVLEITGTTGFGKSLPFPNWHGLYPLVPFRRGWQDRGPFPHQDPDLGWPCL